MTMARVRSLAGGAGADRRIDDRYEKAERLSRTGAGRDREAVALWLSRRPGLMPVKGDRLPVDPKDARHVRMERPFRTSASTEEPCSKCGLTVISGSGQKRRLA